MRKIIAFLGVSILCLTVYGQINFYAGDWTIPPGFASNPKATMRNGTNMPYGFYLQGFQTDQNFVQSPTTNAVDNYLDILNNETFIRSGISKSHNGNSHFPEAEDGDWILAINGNINFNMIARVFSCSNIIDSAYYGNSPLENNPSSGITDRSAGSSGIVCSNVNPAYTIPFDFFPATCADSGVITGSVYATTSGHTNQLESDWLLVEYQLEGAVTWTELATNLNAVGDFAGIISAPFFPTNVYVRARAKDGNTQRAGFPLSRKFFVTNVYVLSVGITSTSSILTNAWPVRIEGVSRSANLVVISNLITGVTNLCTGINNWFIDLIGDDNTTGIYQAIAIGLSSNFVSTETVFVDHDNIAPTTVQCISPADDSTVNVSTITFTYNTADDRHVVDNVEISTNSGISWFIADSIISHNMMFPEGGPYNWRIRATDNVAGNPRNIKSMTSDREFWVFYTVPTVNITSPNNGDSFTTNSTYSESFEGTVSETPEKLWWTNELTGANGVLNPSNAFQFANVLTNGENHIVVFALLHGFIDSDSISITVNIPEKPIVTITSPNNGNNFTTNLVYTETIEGTINILPNELWWTNELTHASGQLTLSNAFSFTTQIINDENTIQIFAVTNGIIGSTTIRITVLEDPCVVITTPSENTILTNDWPVRFEGFSSNATEIILSNIISGTTYPCTGTNNWYIAFTGAYNSAEAYVAVAKNAETTVFSTNSVVVNHDNIAPTTVQCILPADDSTVNVSTITFTYNTDDDRHVVDNVEISTNSGISWFIADSIISHNMMFPEGGPYNWRIRATDNVAGNPRNIKSMTSDREFWVFYTVPTVNITSPNNGDSFTTNSTYSESFEGTVSETPEKLWWTNELTHASGQLTLSNAFSFTTQIINDENTIQIFAITDGIIGSTTIRITVLEDPCVVITTPSENTILTNDWPVRFEGFSSNATEIILSNIISGTTYPCTGTNNWYIAFTGAYNSAEAYVAVAKNAETTVFSTNSVVVNHDNIAPTTVQCISPADDSTVNVSTITFTYNTADDRHVVDNVEISTNSGISWFIADSIISHNMMFPEGGPYNWRIRATDNVAGNPRNIKSMTSDREFWVFYTVPTVNITSPNNGDSFTTNSTYSESFEGTVSETPEKLWWTNELTGANGVLNPSNAFQFANVLTNGENHIVVFALLHGFIDSDSISITVNIPEKPIVTITSPNNGNNFSTNNIYTEFFTGTVSGISDVMWWTNELTHASESLIISNEFDFATSLTTGINIVTVFAGNSGVIGSNSIQITVLNPKIPIVTITNPNDGENYSSDIGAHSTKIVGTIDVIPDSLIWSNSFDNLGGALTPTSSFDVLVDLSIGTNLITIYATKSAVTGSKLISIIVTEPVVSIPYIDVVFPTNWASFSVAHSINIFGIATGDVVLITRNSTDITSQYTNSNWTDSQFIEIGTNSLIYVAVNSVGNSATDIVNYVVTDDSSKIPPYIEVSSPSNLSVYPVPIDIHVTGIATDNFAVVTIFRNGMDITAGYSAPNWSNDISKTLLNVGTNLFTYIATDGDGNSATDNFNFIVISTETNVPNVTIVVPNNGDDYSLVGNNHFSNFIGTVDVVPDSLSWFRACSDGNTNSGNIIPPTAIFSNEIELLIGVNFVKFEAVKGGITGTASMVVTVSEYVPARVLETWPRYIGKSQSGTVEFISTKSASWMLNVINAPGSIQMVANGFCTTGWNLIQFYGSDLPITGNVENFSNLFELVIGELGDDKKDVLQAYSSSIIDDLKTDGTPSTDFDNDSIYVKYITKYAGKCEAKGRTLFVTDGSHDDKLIVKIKSTLGSDGVADICGVFSDSGLKKVRIKGGLDKLQLDGILGSLILEGGSLGRPNDSLRYNVRFNALTTKSKSKIMVKAGKNKSFKIVIPANVNANILVGELEAEPNIVKALAGLKLLKIIGGNLGVEFDVISKVTSRHWLNAKYADNIMVKPKFDIFGGKTFDYSFYFTGEIFPTKNSFKKMYLYHGVNDSSDNNQDNTTIVCGYDALINPVQITGSSWTNEVVKFGFGKIMTKNKIQGTVVIKSKAKQVKGQDDARWIIDGKEE